MATFVAAANSGIWTWRVGGTATNPSLVPAREATGNAVTAGEGLCMWDPGAAGVAGGLYAINVARTNCRVRVHPLTDSDNEFDREVVLSAPHHDGFKP